MPEHELTISEKGIIGHVGKEPENKTTQSGKEMAVFSIGVYAGKNRDTDEAQTVWFNVICMGDAFVLASKFHKGQKVAVLGNLNLNKWTNRDGDVREDMGIWATDIVAVGDDQSNPLGDDNGMDDF
ncbi:hypothetical protein LCGC14_2344590 [marine sediment metagenome]|uniref:Single-stranded DNA-binding protein n=1 Tax=marine sediment metagenome TaxID=412755 RepID=A0A0F9ENP5_9ZZZZ